MMPQQWGSPCGNHCTSKFSALMQIPLFLLVGRVFCKKACTSDGETWEECLEGCNEICYKDPVLKDHQWSAYIDRSPGAANYSAECFNACVSGCAFKFDMLSEKVNQIRPNRSPPPPPAPKPIKPSKPSKPTEDMPGTSA